MHPGSDHELYGFVCPCTGFELSLAGTALASSVFCATRHIIATLLARDRLIRFKVLGWCARDTSHVRDILHITSERVPLHILKRTRAFARLRPGQTADNTDKLCPRNRFIRLEGGLLILSKALRDCMK